MTRCAPFPSSNRFVCCDPYRCLPSFAPMFNCRGKQKKNTTRNARDSTFFEIFPAAPLRLSRSGGRGRRALFELRSSLRVVQAVRAFAQPPSDRLGRRYPEGTAQWGGLLLGYLFLAKQEKVTSCRATPGKVKAIHITYIDAPSNSLVWLMQDLALLDPDPAGTV